MIDRGAKIIVLSSRSGITTDYQAMCLERWKQESVQVVITKLNAVKPEEAKSIIMTAAKLGPVGGIFNLAVVNLTLSLFCPYLLVPQRKFVQYH